MQKAFSKERLGLDVLETDTDRANFETKSKFSLLRQLSIQTAKATKTKSTYVDRQYESALNYSSKFNEYRIAEERKRINQLISGIKVEKGKSMIPSPDVSIITDGKKYMQSRFVQPSYQSVDPNMSVSSKESKKDSKKTLFYDFSNMYKVDKFKSEYLPRMPSDESLTLKKKLPSSEFEKNIKTMLSKVTDPKVNNPREVLRSLLVQIPRGSDPYERLQGEERRQMIEENLDFDSKPIDVNMNITDGEGRVKVIKHKFNPGKIQKQIFEKYSNYLADNRYDTTSIVNQMKHEYSQALDRIQRNVVVIKVPKTYKVWLQDYNDFYHKHEEGEDCEDFPDYLVQTQLDAYLDKKLMREASKAIDESTPLGGSHLKSGHGHKRNKTTSETYSKAHEGSEGNGNEEVEEEEDEDEDDEEDEDEDDSEDGEDEDEDEESEEEVKPKKKKKFFYDRSSSGGSSSSSSSSSEEEESEEEEEEEQEDSEEEEEEKSVRKEGSNSENNEGKGGESPSKVKDYREKRFQGSKKKIDLNKYLDSDMPAKSPGKKVDSDDSSSSDDGRRGNKNNYGYHVKKGINRGDSKAENSPSKKDTKRQESKVRDEDGEAGQEESAAKGHRKRGNKSSKKGKLEKLEEKDGVIEDSDNSSERNEEGGKKKSSKSHKKHKKSHKKSKGKEMYIEDDQASNSEEAQERGEGAEGERSPSKSPSKSKKYLKKKTTSKSPSHFNENNQEEQEEENASPKPSSHKKKKSKKHAKEGPKEEGEVNEEEDGKTTGRRKNKSKSPKSKGQRTVGRLPTEPDGEDQNGQETGTSKASKKKAAKKREGEERDLNGSESPEGAEGGRNRSRDKSERKGHKKQESRSRGNTESPDEERKVSKKKSRDYNSSVSITKSTKNQVDLHKYQEISEEGEDQQDEDYGEESRESIPEIKKVKKRIKSAKQVALVKKEAEPAVKLERRNSMKNPKPAPPAPGGKKATEARGTSKEPQRNNPTTVAGKNNTNANTNTNNNISGNSRSEIGRPQDPRTKKTIQGTTASNTKQQPTRNAAQNQARVIEQKYNNNINSKYYVPGIPLNRNEGLGGLQASGKGFTVTGVTAKKPVAGGRAPQHTGTSSHTRKPEGAPSKETRPKNLPSQKSFVVKKTNVSPILKPQVGLNRGGSLQIKEGGEIGRPEEEDMFNEEMEYLEEQEGDQEGLEENNGQNNEQFDLDRFLNDLQAKEGTKPSIVDMLLMAPSVLENDITIKERQANTKKPLHLRFESDEYERLFEKVYVWHNDLKTDLQDLTERDHLSELQDSDGSDEAPKEKKKKKNPLESDEEDD